MEQRIIIGIIILSILIISGCQKESNNEEFNNCINNINITYDLSQPLNKTEIKEKYNNEVKCYNLLNRNK